MPLARSTKMTPGASFLDTFLLETQLLRAFHHRAAAQKFTFFSLFLLSLSNKMTKPPSSSSQLEERSDETSMPHHDSAASPPLQRSSLILAYAIAVNEKQRLEGKVMDDIPFPVLIPKKEVEY